MHDLNPLSEAGLPKATLTIQAGRPTVEYSPMIFGGFLEHFDRQVYGGIFDPGSPFADVQGFRRDVVAALKQLRVPVVRWPGGCFVSGYRWKLGVGPDRRPTDDMAWGVIEPNTFGTDEYVRLCQLMEWEPFICTNAGNGTIAEMRDWVSYCNAESDEWAERRHANGHPTPHRVPIWSIGNENYHPTEIGYKPIEQWAPLVRDAAREMKAADPTIRLTAAAQATREWTLPLLREAGPYLDYLSIHSYWMHLWQANESPAYLDCIKHSEGPQETLAQYVKILDEAGYRGRIKIAYDEWNLRSWHHPDFPRTTVQDYGDPQVVERVRARQKNEEPSQYTMADALFTASFFNACIRHADDVGMANIAPIINTRGPLHVHPYGIVKRTHFHAMALYANHLQARMAPATLTADPLQAGDRSIPVADAIATTDDAGKQWSIALVNRHPSRTLELTLASEHLPSDGCFSAEVLAGDSPEAFNDVERPDWVTPQSMTVTLRDGVARLPPHSLTILKAGSAG